MDKRFIKEYFVEICKSFGKSFNFDIDKLANIDENKISIYAIDKFNQLSDIQIQKFNKIKELSFLLQLSILLDAESPKKVVFIKKFGCYERLRVEIIEFKNIDNEMYVNVKFIDKNMNTELIKVDEFKNMIIK